MAGYWPTVPSNPASTKQELDHAEWVEKVEKIVFSKTLGKVEWHHTRLVKNNLSEELSRLKEQPGKNLMTFGSPQLVHTLIEHDLIDEYHINLNPILLGGGIPLFKNVKAKENLKLLTSKTFSSGVVGLHYQVMKSNQKEKEQG